MVTWRGSGQAKRSWKICFINSQFLISAALGAGGSRRLRQPLNEMEQSIAPCSRGLLGREDRAEPWAVLSANNNKLFMEIRSMVKLAPAGERHLVGPAAWFHIG